MVSASVDEPARPTTMSAAASASSSSSPRNADGPVARAPALRQGGSGSHCRVQAVGAGHVDDLGPDDQRGQRVADRVVQPPNGLRPTEDHDEPITGGDPEALARRESVDARDVADRRAGHEARSSRRERGARRLEGHGQRGGEPRRRADALARDDVALPEQRRDTEQARREQHRDRDVTTGGEDRRRPPAEEPPQRLRDGQREPERDRGRDGRRGRPSGGSEAGGGGGGCPPPARSRPRARGGRRPSRGQARRVDDGARSRRPAPGRCVPRCPRPRSAASSVLRSSARAGSDCSRLGFHTASRGSSVSREIDSSTPAAAKLTSSDEPPALMNGSVMPVTGRSATTTAMLMNA